MIHKHTSTEIAKVSYDATLNELYKTSEAENTTKARKSDISHFINFCLQNQLQADSEAFLQYIGYLSTVSKYSTLERKYTYVSKWLKEKNRYTFTPEQIEGLKRIKKGAKNKLYTERPVKKAPALQQSVLFPLLDNMKKTKRGQYRNYTLLLVTYFGGFRISEALNMKVEDIAFTPEGATIALPKSKNHQTEKTYKFLPFASSHCPVIALRKLLKLTGIDSGFVFQTFRSKETINSGKPLDRNYAGKFMQKIGGGVFSTHSLRAGFVTDAYERGASITAIMHQTGHKSSEQVLGYVRSKNIMQNNAVTFLV